MTAITYAVGLGAIWRFPYLIGTNGGGAFLLVMCVMGFFIGIPIILCELALGRMLKTTPIAGMRAKEGKGSFWNLLGWLGIAGSILLMSYYTMITGNVAHYLVLTVTDAFRGLTGAQMEPFYNSIMSNTPLLLFYNAVLLGVGGVVISKDVSKGLEKFSKYALPVLFVCLIACMINSLTLPEAGAAIKWFLTPDFSKITPSLLIDCLSQTLFLGGLGMSSVLVFGSYLPDDHNLTRSGGVMILSNIVVAIIAGLTIFPAVFSYGVDPSAGSSLVFQSMPMIFTHMPGGTIFGACFFLTLLVAAYCTCLGLIEGATATLADTFEMKKSKMVWIVVSIIFAIGLIPVFVFTPVLGGVTLFGKDLYTLLDFITCSLVIPIGCFITTIYCGWKLGFAAFAREANKGSKSFKLQGAWGLIFKYICPIVTVVVLFLGIKATFF